MHPSGVEGCSGQLTQADRICLPLCSGRFRHEWCRTPSGACRRDRVGPWWNDPMLTSAPDQELLKRQAALQAEAAQVLAELDLGQRFADVGPVLVVGSYLSG
jgi:hypothetical protein